jgi:tetraacyldisaccharide 4'-kinase
MNFNLYEKGVLNYLLLPLSGLFFLISSARKKFYDLGILNSHKSNAKVIVVGNITVGGTGKTPVVITLTKYLLSRGYSVGVISRGYGGSNHKDSYFVNENSDPAVCGDEPLLIAKEAKVPVVVNKDRVQALKDLESRYKMDFIISDDGLQHYALKRDLEITMIDESREVGNDWLLPAGPYRESKKRLEAVDFIIYTGLSSNSQYSSYLKPTNLVNLKTNEIKPTSYFIGRNCHAVAGIGNPERFFNTLSNCEILVTKHPFPDHYQFKEQDLVFEEEYPILMTKKDCVKCQSFATDNMWYLEVESVLSDIFYEEFNKALDVR